MNEQPGNAVKEERRLCAKIAREKNLGEEVYLRVNEEEAAPRNLKRASKQPERRLKGESKEK